MRRKLLATMAVAVAMMLALPSGALAYNWTKSPVDPLIKGGVHSKAKFKKLMTSSKKVRANTQAVIKADKYPSWVFDAAVKQAAAGTIYSGVLGRGTAVGSMGFGLKKARIVNNTIWKGKGRLPYYYVNASQTTTEAGFVVTTTFKVCLAKTCANPFVIGRRVTRTAILPSVTLHNLYVDTHENTDNIRIGGLTITGTVDGQSVSVQTTDTVPTLVGQFPAGAAFDLTEIPANGWVPLNGGGHQTGTMPDGDLTLVIINGGT